MVRKAVFFSAERQSSAGEARQAPSCSQQLCTFNCVSARRFLPSIESRSCPILLTTPDIMAGAFLSYPPDIRKQTPFRISPTRRLSGITHSSVDVFKKSETALRAEKMGNARPGECSEDIECWSRGDKPGLCVLRKKDHSPVAIGYDCRGGLCMVPPDFRGKIWLASRPLA